MKTDTERLKILETGLIEIIEMVKSDQKFVKNGYSGCTLKEYIANELTDLTELLEQSKK